jgi:hypothetical protein
MRGIKVTAWKHAGPEPEHELFALQLEDEGGGSVAFLSEDEVYLVIGQLVRVLGYVPLPALLKGTMRAMEEEEE